MISISFSPTKSLTSHLGMLFLKSQDLWRLGPISSLFLSLLFYIWLTLSYATKSAKSKWNTGSQSKWENVFRLVISANCLISLPDNVHVIIKLIFTCGNFCPALIENYEYPHQSVIKHIQISSLFPKSYLIQLSLINLLCEKLAKKIQKVPLFNMSIWEILQTFDILKCIF